MAFELLPVELLHHVARYCSIRDIFVLIESCWSLRNAYNDTAFFKRAFIENIPSVKSCSFSNKACLVACIDKQLSNMGKSSELCKEYQQRLVWKCLSMAGSRLERVGDESSTRLSCIVSDPERAYGTVLRSFDKIWAHMAFPELFPNINEAGFLPETVETSRIAKSLYSTLGLMGMSVVWGCSTICHADVMRLLGGLCAFIYIPVLDDPEPLHMLGFPSSVALQAPFCLAICSIENIGWLQKGRPSSYTQDEDRLGFITHALRHHARNTAYDGDDPASSIVTQSIALIMCTLAARACLRRNPKAKNAPPTLQSIPLISQHHIEVKRDSLVHNTAGTHGTSTIPLPEATMSSDTELCDSLSPFITDSWDLWYMACKEAMTDEIDAGEWQWCYTYGLRPSGRANPSMRKIQFQRLLKTGNRIGLYAEGCIDTGGLSR
ncbi:hypothetical protein PG996_011076 [Apiospora saccharicola]|uniref:F-box domain-containing protein n=1 Tax=Apiospora saccharicola TaxID=335842 RepID=A0ABR1UGZ5_9PEZI